MLYIPVTSPSALSSIVNLEWMGDGIDASEAEAIKWINNFGDAEVMSSVVALGWVQDGIEEIEVKAIQELSYINYDDARLASSVIDLGWVRDDIKQLEWEAINWVNNFKNVEVALSVVALAWMKDGIEELEVKMVQELSYVTYDDAGLASSVVELNWVQDGITAVEVEAVDWMNNFSDAEVALSVVELDWVREGIGKQEVLAIEELSFLSRKNEGHASRIVGMPFLETLDPPDVSALASLVDMAWFRQADFQRVLSHPTLSLGITDDWAKIVATLYGVSKNNPDLIDTLLDPEQVSIEERLIELPIAGETLLAIIRTDPGAERSMDLLEHSVRRVEEFIGLEFPNRYVGWLVGEAVTPTFGGNNFGTHIATLPKYDVDDGSDTAEFAGHVVAHEVAHYYWNGNSNWVDEGAADLMASLAEHARTGQPVGVTNTPCGYVRAIAALESLDVSAEDGADSAFDCNYALGERLFVDLYRRLGDEDFRQGLRNLYLMSDVGNEEEMQDNTAVGIEHVRTAFKDVEGVDDQVVDMITARWYDGTEPYDTSARDTDPVNRRFITVNGGIDVAYLAATSGGPPATSFSANSADDWVQLFLDCSYSVGNTTEVPLELVTYFEDGFVFDREYVTFTAAPGFIGATWWLSVGASPSNPWAPGQYRVYVYNEGRKLVELEYQVTE